MHASRRDDEKPDTSAGEAAGVSGFAQLVNVLQARPAPVRRRRREAADAGRANDPVSCIDDLLLRAETCSRSGRIDEAITICHQLRPALAAEGDPARQGWCEFVLTLSHQNAGRSKEAVVAGYKAIEWQALAAPKAPLLRTLVVLASAVARTGDAAGAQELLARAQRLLPEVAHSPRDRCLYWLNSGGTYHALGDLTQAVANSSIAQGLLGEFDDPYLHSVVEMNVLVQKVILAVAACNGVETPELAELLPRFRSHIARLVAAGQHFPVAKGTEDIADAYIALGKMQEARDVLQIGIKSADAAKAGPDRGILELRLARIERMAGQYRRASAHIGLALELLTEGELLKDLAEAHLESSLLSEERQHWRAALDSYRLSAQIRERLLIAQSDARAHALTIRLELERQRNDA